MTESDLSYERSIASIFMREKNIPSGGCTSDFEGLLAQFMDWLSDHNGDLSFLKVP